MIIYKNIIEVLYKRFLIDVFDIYEDESKIPNGMYCFDYETEKLCKYYKPISRNYDGCSYLGIISDDLAFNDMCKICGKNLKLPIYDENDNIVDYK